MKVMEVSMEEKTANIEMVTPPRKKMKQAQLPFQMLNPLGASNKNSTKKRKLSSPSPVDLKSPRTGKSKKQNAAKRAKSADIEVIELALSEDDGDHQESDKRITNDGEDKKADESTVDKEPTAGEEKTKEKDTETDVKKKKDYNVLNMFLKKAQSLDAKDDIQLLAMSDYESGNSKDSDAVAKQKAEAGSEMSETPEESLAKESDSNKETETSSKQDEHEDEKTDDKEEEKLDDKEKHAEDMETENSDDLDCNKKDSITSDDNDGKNEDSDSDICALSSDEDADDEPDKSSNENGDKDKTTEGNDGSKTPRNEKSSNFRNRKLTPKQIERRLQSAKKREEKLRLKQEKEKKREEEREMRRKEKEEKREEEREMRRKEKEDKRKEKEEKEKVEKEQKRKEKKMKDLKKQIEIEQKQKEKEAKEEERRKREEEKLEAERKKQKAASNFANFFVPKKQENKAAEEENVVKDQIFMPFEVKVDMRVAPITRRNLNEKKKLHFDGVFNKDLPRTELYLNELKQNPHVVGRSEKTWPYEAKDDVVIIDEDDGSSDAVDQGAAVTEKHHPKLFLFAENRRPPFWGTWRKKSDHINPRRPFAKDSKWFDYDVDSDDEWEEEEPGESIRGSDDERDEEGPEENEYDVDNDFMVPHGYLSDEEAKADEEDGEDMSPETQKLKLKLLGEQFEAERKTKTSKIKPKVIGCVWQGSVNAYPENTAPNVVQILLARQAWVTGTPIVLHRASTISENVLPSSTECGSPGTTTVGAKKTQVPEKVIPELIRLVHGNINSRMFLVKEFMTHWHKNKIGDMKLPKVSVVQKINEIADWLACPEEGPLHLRSCWYVKEEVREKYNCLEITLPNRWEYALRPNRKSDVPDIEKPDKPEKEKKRIPLITQFTKKITQEEMQKQLVSKPNASASKPPKRVALISVPRGEQFQQSSRNDSLSKFVTTGVSKTEQKQEAGSLGEVMTRKEEVITLDDSDEKKTNPVNKDSEASADLIKAAEAPPETQKSTENIAETENESVTTEPMETEEDCVIILED